MELHPDLASSLRKRQRINRYSRWMYNSFKKYLGNRILDIGSGTGNMIDFYIKDCEKIVATDIFEHQIDYIKERFKDFNNIESFVFDIARDDISKLKEYNFDTVTCINVLEHIEDDTEALRKMKELVNTQGNIILLVPAFNWLYGTMDKKCGHYRRYNRGELISMAKKLNLELIYHSYFNFFGMIPWYLKGKVFKKQGTFSDDLNEMNSRIYNIASTVLEPLESIVDIPLGISEIVVLKNQ